MLPDISMPPVYTTKPVKIDTTLHQMLVKEQFKILQHYIQDFEQTLDTNHEVGIMMTNFGQSVVMQVTEITYEEPVILVFRGYVNGKMSTLIQHMNQLNFLLTSLDKIDERPKNPIGFIVPEK